MKKGLPFLLILGLLVACAPAGPTLPPIAYQDNFDDTNSGWAAEAFDTGENSYQDGRFRMLLSTADWFSWVVNPTAAVYQDARVEADAHKTGGPDANEFGILCRVNYDESNFYVGAITSNGQFAIYKSIGDGGLELVGMAAMGFSPAIKLGEEPNHLRFDCVGNTLTLFANDSQLVQVTDETLAEGEAGLYIGTFDEAGTEILFDNFVVYKP
jgi:hypothetical protein